MIIRKTADMFTNLVTAMLWVAVVIWVLVLLFGLVMAGEAAQYGGNFGVAFIGAIGAQLAGATLFVLLVGMFAVFIDIRLTLIEIRDNGLLQNNGLNAVADIDANKPDEIDRMEGKQEPTLTTKPTERDSLAWQNTDQFGAIAKDASGNSLREFIDANQSIFEAKGVTTKVVHGGKSWLVDLNGSKGTKSFNQSQLQSLIEWVDED
jgi:hypothetical protein